MTQAKVSNPLIAALPLVESSFTETFLALRDLGIFYGTDTQGNHDSFMDAIQKALQRRIGEPIGKCVTDPRTCFFKPYANKPEAANGFMYGIVNPLFVILAGLGYLGAWASNPASLIAMLCSPAIMELLVGFFGLLHGLSHQAKFCHGSDVSEQDEARAYFLDAGVRFVLVIPLALVCLIAAPAECARFFTRAVWSLIDCLPKQAEAEEVQHLSFHDI